MHQSLQSRQKAIVGAPFQPVLKFLPLSPMTTLADDLLRTRTIPELRDLVNSLEKDSSAKRTELQLMVGSKYHDFIQSADKIASMKEKSTMLEQQIDSFWKATDKLVSQAKTVLDYSQPEQHRAKPSQPAMALADITSAIVWNQLNDCDVYSATKSVVIANLLTNAHDDKSIVGAHLDASSRERLQCFGEALSVDVRRHLNSVRFLSDTVVNDIHLLLLCDTDTDTDGEEIESDTSELVEKAMALAALSVAQAPLASDAPSAHIAATGSASSAEGSRRLLQTYLSAAEVRVQDILDTQLTADLKGAGHEHALRTGLVTIVKLLQRIVMDVHVLFLSTVDLTAAVGTGKEGQVPKVTTTTTTASGQPILGLVSVFQDTLLHELTQQVQLYLSHVDGTAAALRFDHARALQELTTGPGSHAVGAGHTVLQREQRKAFKIWLDHVLSAVTARCKAVLSGLTSAAEVAHLQQQVWAACINIAGSATAAATANKAGTTGAVTLKGALSAYYSYNQRHWEAASANLLAATTAQHQAGADGSGSSGAHAYLWCNVFRACFLHQVERLLKSSCEEVLVATKTHILRLLRQQGVTVDAATLKATVSAAASSADQQATAGKKRNFGTADYAGDASQLSSPKLYQLAERVRQQFEQDMARLLSDVLEPVVSTESNSPVPDGSGSNLTAVGDSADPQSAGALARAMRTQCAQLVGHAMVLLRNLLEACQEALRERGSLPASAGAGDLYECLRGGDQQAAGGAECLLTPDVHDILRRYAGCNLTTSGATLPDFARSSASGSDKRGLDRADHSLLSGVLFLGRLAWLFKIRGAFLEYALQPRAANWRTPSVDASSSGANLRSISGPIVGANNQSFLVRVQDGRQGAMCTEDQFRSAFEIADTNGDGVLSYQEALEALSALSGEGDLMSPIKGVKTPASSSTPSAQNHALAFNLSTALTPTLTYTEFALICGSTMLSAEEGLPVVRLGRCLEQLIAAAHVTWAVATVHLLGRPLREQYVRELGLAVRDGADGAAKTARAAKRTSTADRERNKPFKIHWVAKWIDLDGNIDEDGGSGGAASAQKESVLIPGAITSALQVFLHKITEHGSACTVSMDTLQSVVVTAQSAANRAYTVTGGAGSGAAAGTGKNKATPAAAMRDEFSDLLGEIHEVSDSEGEESEATNPFFEPNGLLATLAGAHAADGAGGGVSVVLSHLALRTLSLVGFAYFHYVSMAVLSAARPAGASAAAAAAGGEVLEDAAMQAVFDLSVLEKLAQQWRLAEWQRANAVTAAKGRTASFSKSTTAVATVGLSTAIAKWKAHLDPINAELVMPVVQVAVISHAQALTLLSPHCSDLGGRDTPVAPRAPTSTATGAKTSEQLLARVFPTPSQTAPRLALLPLAVSMAPTPTAAGARPSSTGSIPGAHGAGGSTKHAASSGNLTGDAAKSAGASASASTSAKAKTGVMNWW